MSTQKTADQEIAAVVYDDVAFQQYAESDRYLAFAIKERMTNVDGTPRDPKYLAIFREALFNSEIRENSHECRKWNAFLAARAAAVPSPAFQYLWGDETADTESDLCNLIANSVVDNLCNADLGVVSRLADGKHERDYNVEVEVHLWDGTSNRAGGLTPTPQAALIDELTAALKLLQAALTEHNLRDIKKRFSLCVADAAAGSAIAKAEKARAS